MSTDTDIQIATAAATDSEPTIRITVEVPASTAVALKHRTGGALDVAETISLLLQLYADAPIQRRPPVVLDEAAHARICEVLGFTPQSTEQLVGAICELASFGFGGVKLRLTKDEIDVLVARNSLGVPTKEWAEQIFRVMFDAWRYGRI